MTLELEKDLHGSYAPKFNGVFWDFSPKIQAFVATSRDARDMSNREIGAQIRGQPGCEESAL
ncbi:hypothetical protein FRB95_010086 [Tulasnella sp. JGI-2019a]|nr:hypothetical protein FRB95_010086 [Tulasnella sp. JGI-2019a]